MSVAKVVGLAGLLVGMGLAGCGSTSKAWVPVDSAVKPWEAEEIEEASQEPGTEDADETSSEAPAPAKPSR